MSLSGIIPPIITPLRGRDELDVAGLERLIAHLLAGGVSGLFLLGTTGEGPSLSYRLRRELIQRACRLVNQRVPILVGITDTSFSESLNLAGQAAEAGADFLVVAPPFYLPPSQEDLQQNVEHLVPELPLPLLLYNIPSVTKVSFAVETLRRLAQQARIVGLKDSSGDIAYFRNAVGLLQQRPDWSLLIGAETLLPEAIAAGGHGGICSGANVFPRLFVRLVEAIHAGNAAEVGALQDQVVGMGKALYGAPGDFSAVIKGIKCALSWLGICEEAVAEPLQPLSSERRDRIRRGMESLAAP